ncbi:MAG: phosphocholine cytidylyltransferase family protein [Myxococcales bacterium]|nr:phosphocholine cytidylyltransferase family protein [Myxococcales bacterium]
MRPHVDHAPKTLVPVAGVPILRRTLTTLVRAGVDQIVIVIGHLQLHVRAAVARWFPHLDVTFVENPAYETTSTAASLALARPHVDGRAFFLVDGDVVFDASVIDRLFEGGPDAVAVRSVGSLGAEEVKVTADERDRVVAIGKDVLVRGAMGEAIGVQLLSAATSRRLFAALAQRATSADLYYEAIFQELVDAGVGLHAVELGSLYACEIDTVEDLRAADAQLARGPAFDARPGFRVAV